VHGDATEIFEETSIDAEPAGIPAPVLEEDVPSDDRDGGPPTEVSTQNTPVAAEGETGTITSPVGDDK
jgi:hypothetical protein